MSFLSFKPTDATVPATGKSVRSAFSQWLLANYGADYRITIKNNSQRPNARLFNGVLQSASTHNPTEPLVGIVGGGFAGLFSGIILQSLGIGCEIFESSARVGGRIRTWYSTDYNSENPDQAGLYGEVGGMRLPQFSEDMLPVQQLALAINSVLGRNGLDDKLVYWRKFYYNSPVQRLRYNNMDNPITSADSGLSAFNFDQKSGGDIAAVWTTPKKDQNGNEYLPINKILDMVNNPFLEAINKSFESGFALLMQYDQYSMWDYLTTIFTLGDMNEYYDPAMGAKSDLLPWSIANFLETTNVGSGMYSVSFVEMVIAVYDWGGSKNPYNLADQNIYMLTVDKGMQHFPDACLAVLNLADGVHPQEGVTAQIQVGMLPSSPDGSYSYNPPNLTPDAQPPQGNANKTGYSKKNQCHAAKKKQRVFLEHNVIRMEHDSNLYQGHGGMKLTVEHYDGKEIRKLDKQYPYVITTLPASKYLNGQDKVNLLDGISFQKATALRSCNYMSSFKAFLTFKTQFWATLGNRQEQGLGAAATDRPNRQIIYPSYGYEGKGGVLQVYCWALDARKLGAMSDEERINECLKGIQYLYPEVDVLAEFSGYHDGKTTKTWFWDQESGGGAFALFDPGQFKNLYPTLLTPEFNGCLNFAGECCSVHHGWIVGALDSAYNAVLNILTQIGASDKIDQMKNTWGTFNQPDIADNPYVDSVLDYAYQYNEIDRRANAIAPNATESIYGNSDFVFSGNVPAFIDNFSSVPQSMKATAQDKEVVQLLNNQWNDNVAQRAKQKPVPLTGKTAVEKLEAIYYGNNFQTIPAPAFWLKDDDEFARQQLAGFMPNLLERLKDHREINALDEQLFTRVEQLGLLNPEQIYVANYRQYLSACTVTPTQYYLPKPIIVFTVNQNNQLIPVAIQLDAGGEVFTPHMQNAENTWLLAKMLANCAGQTLHDVGFHQLYTHQLCALVSIALFSEEVFNPLTAPASEIPFQEHPVFKLLAPHLTKTVEFQQTIYNKDYNPYAKEFPATRAVNGSPGVYNLGFVYDQIFSCGRIGNYQLQDKMYNNDGKFRFLDMAIKKDVAKRAVQNTPFSYAYAHDATLWYDAIAGFVKKFVDTYYESSDQKIADDIQLQRFFNKLIPAFNYVDGIATIERFPTEVRTVAVLNEVLSMIIWQFSVQHTVVNDGAYNMAAFVPNASTLMYAPPATPSAEWTPDDVLNCLPSQDAKYESLGNMNFMDVQINASVTGQGPYPETMLGRGLLEPSLDILQDTYNFVDPRLRNLVDDFYQDIRAVGAAIQLRKAKDTANYLTLNPDCSAVPETVVFNRLAPIQVMNTIQT